MQDLAQMAILSTTMKLCSIINTQMHISNLISTLLFHFLME